MICLVQMLLPGKNKDALRLLEWVEHGRYPSALLHFDHLHSCEWCISGRDVCTSKSMLSQVPYCARAARRCREGLP